MGLYQSRSAQVHCDLDEQFRGFRVCRSTLIFIVVLLGTVARWSGMPLMQFLRYFKDEILITLGTCSTEAVLPRMMVKLEKLGCKKIGDGHGVAYGLHIQCGWHLHSPHHGRHLYRPSDQYATEICGSDDSAGCIPADFERLGWGSGCGLRDACCNAHNHPLNPSRRSCLLLGIDRFLSEARAVTNLIGNGIGTIAIPSPSPSPSPSGTTRSPWYQSTYSLLSPSCLMPRSRTDPCPREQFAGV